MTTNATNTKEHVSLVTCGHVDSGKSTTCGRLIYDLGGIPEREMQKLKDEAIALGKQSFEFAFYMDTSKVERERGITIQCTTKEFFTDKYHFTIIDSPGHRDYIANAIGGQSQADCALLLVPASGEFTTAIAKLNREEGQVMGQSRMHARLVNLLGVKQLIVGINKMDTSTANCPAYSEERYNEVKDEIANMLVQVGWNKDFVKTSVPFIPYSAWKGDNMVKQSTNMPWWKGQDVKTLSGKTVHVTSLMEALNDYTEIPKRATDAPFRMPVSQVITTIKGVPLVACGKIEQGVLKPGDEVVFLPRHTESNPCGGKIFSIEMHRKSQDSATVGDNIGCQLKGLNKDYLPEHGNIMVLKSDTLRQAKRFTTQVQVLDHPGELKVGYTPIGLVRTSKAPIKMVEIKWKMGKETGGKKLENPTFVKAGEVAEIVWEPQLPLVVEAFDKCEGLSRLAVMDSNVVCMVAKTISVEY